MTCQHCHKVALYAGVTPWCQKCRARIHYQRASARGWAHSLWTRRLKAQLRDLF